MCICWIFIFSIIYKNMFFTFSFNRHERKLRIYCLRFVLVKKKKKVEIKLECEQYSKHYFKWVIIFFFLVWGCRLVSLFEIVFIRCGNKQTPPHVCGGNTRSRIRVNPSALCFALINDVLVYVTTGSYRT